MLGARTCSAPHSFSTTRCVRGMRVGTCFAQRSEEVKRMVKNKIRIRMEAYDHQVLDGASVSIVETAKRTGARVHGPIPLPTRIERYTVLRSPHVDKKSREQFEMRTHKRIIEISEATAKTMDALTKINMPAGVNIRIKI